MPTTTTLPIRDWWVFDWNTNFNYWVNSELQIRKTASAQIMRSLIAFTLPSLSWTITKITLTLKKSTNLSATWTINVHTLTQSSWTEWTWNWSATWDGATWNTYNWVTNWSTWWGDFNATLINSAPDPASVGNTVSIDILWWSAINPISASWWNTIHLLLKQSTETWWTDTWWIYYSREATNSVDRPYLTIEYSTWSNSWFFNFFYA